ncbi:MAG: hypothetical protein QOG62_1227 [Thermoleophilaceae bacterium]|nr:hypothetical protein [Thermoleophilaceae bacterium]
MQPAVPLPELAGVSWRSLESGESLARRGRIWTAWTLLQAIPFVGVAALLMVLEPLSAPVAFLSLVHAWVIPELYAFRGSNVVRPKPTRAAGPEEVAQGLLGDLLDHEPRELQRQTGLALEPGAFGIWLVGEGGAVLVAPGGRRVHCFCVGVSDGDLPPSDRIAHLLLALRQDEIGFATVANSSFSGAAWRLRRRMAPESRPALTAAVAAARRLRD